MSLSSSNVRNVRSPILCFTLGCDRTLLVVAEVNSPVFGHPEVFLYVSFFVEFIC